MYTPDLVDMLPVAPRRGTRHFHNEYPPAQFDPHAPLAELLGSGRPPCAQDGLPDQWVDSYRWDDVEPLVRVCDSCPLRKPCLDYALLYEMVGVWGGTTTAQRRRIRSRQRRTLRYLRELESASR